ncbi:MAG: PP2C family protein-serine/threonine phosphatase [Bacillota bacterium]|jgi:sigma-B regulation protein RsbU (phosphoserine phosphatase)
MLEGLGALAGAPVRLWRSDGSRLRLAAGGDPGAVPPAPAGTGLTEGPDGTSWLVPVPDVHGFWLEVDTTDAAEAQDVARHILPLIAIVLDAARERSLLSEELASRYEEIDLLYAITEILGRTVSLEEAAQIIVREVSGVVGARRASIMVFDETAGLLRTVAERGFSREGHDAVPVGDDCSIAARVFRERRMVVHDPTNPSDDVGDCGEDRGYQGEAFLSVPISYAGPGGPGRCVGVINLTDRIGGDRFTAGDRKLVAAIANQIGAAIENARLVQIDRRQQRLRRELELAHDLQLRLLPSPSVLGGDAEVAALCVPAESVGGDFYTFSRLGRGRVGVMLGDVASHGFSAALVMALVLSAAGIHSASSLTPDETLIALLDGLATELRTTEMYLTVFYGVLDPETRRLTYANAGHAYAFRIPANGPAERLSATAPPLGLASAATIERRQLDWETGRDLLCLCTDGLIDAKNGEGESFGEDRLLTAVAARRTEHPAAIVAAVMDEVAEFVHGPRDDRTLLVLRI